MIQIITCFGLIQQSYRRYFGAATNFATHDNLLETPFHLLSDLKVFAVHQIEGNRFKVLK